MRRLFFTLLLSLLGGLFLMSPAQASTNDFTIKSFEADYYLSKNSDGRSTLKTVEKIVAEFPNFDQNHGIERALPAKYQKHTTSLSVQSVTDAEGQNLEYTTNSSGDNKVLRIGSADQYVKGEQTYVITYTQQDVTGSFASTKSDEFYWDVNGTQWSQPFDSVVGRVHLTEDLNQALNSNQACYQGQEGSQTTCPIIRTNDGFEVSANNLLAGQNVTLSIGFAPQTFMPYQQSLTEKLFNTWLSLLSITSTLAIGLIIWLSVRWRRLSRRSAEAKTIIPEYLPPKNINLFVAAHFYDGAQAATTAQLLDLAVRHFLKIYQTGEKTMWHTAKYELEIIKDISDLQTEEKEFLEAIFSNQTSVGSRLDMALLAKNRKVTKNLLTNATALKKRIKETYALRAKDNQKSAWFKRAGWIILLFALITLSPLMLIAATVAFALSATLYPLTDRGLALRQYLLGLKLYITVAEAQRLKMLQSPEGAQKVGVVDANDQKQLIKLYEKVLPYAVLFGQEKEWNKQLGFYYENNSQQPDWYAGNGVFNAVVFSSAMSSFSTTTSTYASAGDSSSGGSSGGGSSGGGGGGGGGGGW